MSDDEELPICPYCDEPVPEEEQVQSAMMQGWGEATCHRECVVDAGDVAL